MPTVEVKVEVTAIRAVEVNDCTVVKVVIDWLLASCDIRDNARNAHAKKSAITRLD